MNEVSIIFLSIFSIFVLLLIVRSIFKLQFCVLCGSVFLTWAFLLTLYWFGFFENQLLIAIPMGGSVVGIYYLAERKTKEILHIFRLPFFLTLLFSAYMLIGIELTMVRDAGIFIAALWLLCGLIYVYRNSPKFKGLAATLLKCCKNW